MADHITFTTKIGAFVFKGDVPLSRAKLIRDEILGQALNPKRDLPKLKTEDDICAFALNHLGNILAGVPFEIYLGRAA